MSWSGPVRAESQPANPSRLDLTVVDADSGEPVHARVRLRDTRGCDIVPADATVVNIGARDRWFVCSGRCSIELPVGTDARTLDVRVERGTEYRPYRQRLEPAGERTEHVVRLQRWINMRQHGYVCGENHLHASAEELAPQLLAEGLDFGTSLQWWNGPKYEVQAAAPCVQSVESAGRRVPISIYDYELEHDWGAAYVLGLPQPLDAPSDARRPNLPLLRQARAASALICYQGGWSREVLLDALLGLVDVVNVCNNNFHRHQFQPRSNYSNLLNVPGLPTYPDTPEGMMQMNTDTYYRLLNCGLRLAAGAGSAKGAKNTPAGYNRAYVRAGENPDLPAFWAAWRAGRNFVTNGPMLFLQVDGRQPGDEIALAGSPVELTIRAQALSEQPLTSLEIVINGSVVARADDIKGDRAEVVTRWWVSEPCWIAARCTERDDWLSDSELAAGHAYGGRLPCRPCRLRFAHTSPAYVTVNGRGVRVPAAVAEASRMLDAFETFARNQAAPAYLEEITAALADARRRLLEP